MKICVLAILIAAVSSCAADGCTNLVSSKINQFFKALQISKIDSISFGQAGSLTDIVNTGLDTVTIADIKTDESCGKIQLKLNAKELQVDANYISNHLTIPGLVTDLTGSGQLKIVINDVTVGWVLDINLANCLEINQVSDLVLLAATGKVTLSGNPDKANEINTNGLQWLATNLPVILQTYQPQLLQYVRPHIVKALNCSC